MHDIIQDSPIFKMILQEGMEKGLEQGRELGMEQGRELGLEQGLEQGRLEAARHILLIVTEKHFPALAPLAQEQAARIQALDEIDALIVAITSAQNELEAQNALRENQ